MSSATTSSLRQSHDEFSPWDMLSHLLPTADLTANGLEALQRKAEDWDSDKTTAKAHESSSNDTIDHIARALYRREQRHVLLTGLPGVGKTETVREMARQAAAGEIPFLRNHRFLWIDAVNVGSEDSRACLETVLGAVEEIPNVVLCLDGFDALLKRPNGGTNKPLVRAMAARSGVQIIGLLDRWAFNDLIAGDAKMLELFGRIDIEEPNESKALDILRHKAKEFEREYELTIGDDVIQRTIALASNYLLSECHPAKGIKVLRQACDEAHFEATQRSNGPPRITVRDPVRIVSERTGIPEATLNGDSGDADFESALSAAVIGQPRAVKAAATELRLIRAGLSEPNKPAGVLLFAGMTGVGKTELAKRIAELYSTSRRLQTYAMGNFTEPHSVSGIIGVPPGYVGHEEGGRLVNELNADPYSVFLLDEAEKCHPNVWKPFLHLFDEGWIADQRGVKAYADRAIFILTTNAGDRTIAQMSRQDKPEEAIVERVRATLSRVRQERSSQPVFTPQFLARLKRIVVFGPLDEAAMIGIARKIVKQVAGLWKQKREKQLLVAEDVIDAIGQRGHALNEKANGEEGGRIVRKLISDLIEHNVQLAATDSREDYRACRTIRVELVAAEEGEKSDGDPDVHVTFE